MKTSMCRSNCCTVRWCPLVSCWATTIHKFQGFEAGFDETDMFRYLMVDPGNLKWEQDCPGALYVALSRAKTMGTFMAEGHFTKKSAIYWKGDGISKTRIIDGSLKNGLRKGDPKVKCENIVKRDTWVNYLKTRRNATSDKTYSEREIWNIRNKRYSQGELQDCIFQMITEPNSTWQTLKKAKYLTPKTYFGTYG